MQNSLSTLKNDLEETVRNGDGAAGQARGHGWMLEPAGRGGRARARHACARGEAPPRREPRQRATHLRTHAPAPLAVRAREGIDDICARVSSRVSYGDSFRCESQLLVLRLCFYALRASAPRSHPHLARVCWTCARRMASLRSGWTASNKSGSVSAASG